MESSYGLFYLPALLTPFVWWNLLFLQTITCVYVRMCVWKEQKAIIIASSRARFNCFLPLYVFSCCVFLAVFLRSHKSLESVDPQFTMRRKMEQLREELELMEQLREVEHRQFNVQWLVIKGKLQLAITLCVVYTVSLTGCLPQWLNPSN